MAEYRENDNGANRKNSCDRSYCSHRNYRTDHIEVVLIGQHTFILLARFLFEPFPRYLTINLYILPIITTQMY